MKTTQHEGRATPGRVIRGGPAQTTLAGIDIRDGWLALARAARFAAPEMARLLGISLRQLERAFQEAIGGPSQEWLHHARLWDACARLCQGQSPKELYEGLGFKGITGFFHAFKEYHGWTGREYLLQHQRRQSPGLNRLRQICHLDGALRNAAGGPQHAVALAALAQVLSRSDRLSIYYLRSPWRRQAADVAPEQQVSPHSSLRLLTETPGGVRLGSKQARPAP